MFSILDIVTATSGKLVQGSEDLVVNSVSIDSRNVDSSQVFIAIKGDIFDGHDFIHDVVSKGIKVFIVHKLTRTLKENITVILVKDTTKALGHLAKFHRDRFKIPLIALTGSTGKTTTKEMISAVLSTKLNVLKSEGTQNNHIGVPLTLLKMTTKHQVAIIECGTNQPGDIPWLAQILSADVVVFTNIGHSHLEKLKTPQGVLKEKISLINGLKSKGTVVYNADDNILISGIKKLSAGKKGIGYSIRNEADFRADQVEVKDGLKLSFKIGAKNFELKTCSINNVYNALAAYICGNLFKIPMDKIVLSLKTFEFPKGRGQILKLGSGWMINDAYNSNPTSMLNAIQMLQSLNTKGKRIMVVADMLELGSKSKELHAQIGHQIAKSNIQALITVGALSRHLAAKARKTNKNLMVTACADIESAQKTIAKILSNGDSVLIKGSRRMAMERIVEFLQMSPGSSI